MNTEEHLDQGLITLSVSNQNDELQVFDTETQTWINAETKGCAVLMAGGLLQYAAPGVFEPCRHSVISLQAPLTSLTYKVLPSRDWILDFPPLSQEYIPDSWAEC
eukprot:857615-Rhodomonas_salina.2